jgi:adenylate cyclase
MIFELIGRQNEPSVYGTPDELKPRLEAFAAARELYRHRQWDQAQQKFYEILTKWPNDGPARTYWKRCQEYLFDEPPSGWDGVFTMTHK